jgi:hypothetical protein
MRGIATCLYSLPLLLPLVEIEESVFENKNASIGAFSRPLPYPWFHQLVSPQASFSHFTESKANGV